MKIMSLDSMTYLMKLHNTVAQMDEWIKNNHPSSTKSNEIFNAFIERISFKGSDAFIAKTKRVIEKASKLSAGFMIMQRILNTGVSLSLEEDEEAGFIAPNTLKFGFTKPKYLQVCLNEHMQRIFHRSSRAATFIHESLHAWHYIIDPEKEKKLTEEKENLPDMDSAAEERVITGDLHRRNVKDADFCCENTALRELEYPIRINHRGPDSLNPDIHDMVRHRMIESILILSKNEKISTEIKKNLTPLELAMHLYLLDDHPETQSEWINLMHVLLINSSPSEHFLKLAILIHAKELVLPLLNTVTLSDELRRLATLDAATRQKLTWEILEESKWVISDARIENLYNEPFVCESQHPAFFLEQKQDQQRKTVSAKFKDHESVLSLDHKLEKFEPNPDYDLDDIYFACTVTEKKQSSTRLNRVSEEERFDKNTHGFTLIEVEQFIKNLNPRYIRNLASIVSSQVLSSLQCCYSNDWELEYKLTDILEDRFSSVLSSPTNLIQEFDAFERPIPYADIVILSDSADCPIAKANTILNGRYTSKIKDLRDTQLNPFSNIICRLQVHQLWISTVVELNFVSKIQVNGKEVSKVTIG